MATRFGAGNQAWRGRKPREHSLPSAQELATPHLSRAIERLAELMELGGSNSPVARAACKDMVSIASPDLEEERVKELVEKRLREMLEEAEARALAAEEVKP